MSQFIQAAYEDGVLKPLEPITLTEHQRVCLIVSLSPIEGEEVVVVQRKAMEELDAELEALPDCSPDDGAANADP